MNIAHILQRAAKADPEARAVSVGLAPVHTFQSLSAAVSALASSLRTRFGLSKGDRVALAMTNTAEFFEIAFAVWHAGLCLVPTNPRLHRREFAYIFENSGAKLCFVSPDLMDTVSGLEAEVACLERLVAVGDGAYNELLSGPSLSVESCSPDDPAWIFYTSGTTGRPKGATLTHRNIGFMVQGYYADIDRVDVGDTMLHPASLAHGAGLYSLPHLAQGGHQVVCRGSFDPAEIFMLLETYPEVSFFAAPTMLTRLVSHMANTGSGTGGLRTIIYGGGPMYVADLERALDVLGHKLVQLYGQGEAPMTITILPKSWHKRAADLGKLGSCGVARTLVEMRIVGEDGQEVQTGEIGEVTTRSDCVMIGYWNAPEATASALKDGWLHTGDLGSVDERGYLTLKDRSKDMIISGGSNIYPREIEEVLLQHPSVLEAAVVGRRNADWGEEAVAFIAFRPSLSATEAELDALCLEHIARYKRPRSYFFVSDLPKNNYGKVLKTALREWLADEARLESKA